MKMAVVSTVTVLLLCCSFVASADSTDCSHHATINGDFTVPLQHNLQPTDRLKWKHGTTIIYDSRQDKQKGISSNGSLILKNVDISKKGEYTPEVFDSNGRNIQNLKGISLCVWERVPKPKVTITCPTSSTVQVTCGGVPKDKEFQIAWFQNEKQLVKEKGSTLKLEAEKVETASFVCEVSNKASSSKSEPVIQNCFTSGFVLPEDLWGINIWIFVGGGAGVVVLLILIVIICCIHNRRRQRVQLKDEEELRLGWTNPNQQQQQQQQPHHHHHHQHNHPPNQPHHHHHQQQQPAGHTGPRQHRKKQQHNTRPKAPDPNAQPEPSPRRQGLSLPKPPESADDEQPPPLPQPRKKGPRTPRV